MKSIIIAVVVTLAVTLGGVGVYASAQNQKDYGVFTPFPKTETKTETKEEPISFTIEKAEDSSLPSGEERTTQQGENGVQTHTYKVTYKGKKKVKDELLDSKVTKPPKNSVVAVGTYTAPVASAPARSSGGSSGGSKSFDFKPTVRMPTSCTTSHIGMFDYTTCY